MLTFISFTLTLYLLVAFMLIFKYSFLGFDNWEDLRNQFAAFALLSSWVHLVMEAAKLSSTINVYVTMLTRIVQTMAMIMVSFLVKT